eukprot:UN07806
MPPAQDAIYTRLHAFMKNMLYTPSSGLYSCPNAMTDGAAFLLLTILQQPLMFFGDCAPPYQVLMGPSNSNNSNILNQKVNKQNVKNINQQFAALLQYIINKKISFYPQLYVIIIQIQ